MSFLLTPIEKFLEPYQKSRLKLIEKLIGKRAIDALLFKPNSFIDRINVGSISLDLVGKNVSTVIRPLSFQNAGTAKNRPVKLHAISGDKTVEVVFFNSKFSYLKKFANSCNELGVSGKLSLSQGGILQFIHPDYIGYKTYLNSWTGRCNVYPLTNGLSQSFVSGVISKILKAFENNFNTDWLPPELTASQNWPSFQQAIFELHFPKQASDLTLNNKAIQRLLFDETLAEQIAMKVSSYVPNIPAARPIHCSSMLNKFLEKLPFTLTIDQVKVVKEIDLDIVSGQAMRRLLQGDVGSGKTIVALISTLKLIESGYQCAFLAPTEILAVQHFNSCNQYLYELGINITLLTSHEKGRKRQEILEGIKSGIINVIVGTHAIFGKAIEFYKLGLVIIDEQHRFGVNQRLDLIEKGCNPHVLSMTATPIPRTLILSNYGDITVSEINHKPKGRKDIITKAIPMSQIEEVIQSVKRIISVNQKVYWVCPLIEESEKLDYTCVINRFNSLKSYFGETVSMLHGKMKQDEKTEIFEQFKNGQVNVLVSTTVIEVGVDVPNATVIIIENAEKFGLAQLHQLRGRVGRSDLESYCILLFDKKISEIGMERIKAIRDINDGFRIAEKDLLLRGSGEVLGTKQSGLKKSRFYDVDEYPVFEGIINSILQMSSELASSIVQNNKVDNYNLLLEMFQHYNFESLRKSF